MKKKPSFSFLLAEGISFLTTLSELEALRCPLSTFSINIKYLRDYFPNPDSVCYRYSIPSG